MWHVYILKCSDNTLYTGIAKNLSQRIAEHNSEKSQTKYTRARQPVKLVFSKRKKTRATAAREEAQIKKLSRLEKLKYIKK
ncbi:GIY-YIG nuclease family protein [Patescibacteria group bacterium]